MPDEHQENTPATAASEAAETDAEGADEPAVPSPRLLEILVCPLTRSTLEISEDRTELISRRAPEGEQSIDAGGTIVRVQSGAGDSISGSRSMPRPSTTRLM